jgi:NAD(P)-dependent dehydrogenase (short-subunit alcohol dehydrogenase family)
MSGRLAGKVAVITGSTQGLGAAVARRYVGEGARVMLSGRTRANGEAVARELGAAASFHESDLTRVEDCKSLIEAALAAYGGIDILVNSAADTNRSTVADFTPEQFDRQVHLNLRAPLLLAQAALPSLKERRGVVINIGSINAYIGEPKLLVYSATKGALETASRNLAHALRYTRVRVFCLNVGWMDSDGERAIMAKLGHPPDFLDATGERWPLGRLLKPEDVAQACLFLASDEAQAFSGAVIELEQFPVGALSDPSLNKGLN